MILPLGLAACASPSLQEAFGTTPTSAAATATGAAEPLSATPPETLDPTPPPPPPPAARTVEEFDTTTEEDRAEAVAEPEAAPSAALGTTQATLGSPADPGIWVKTPLVSETVMGRVEYQGNSINVELRPSGGEAGSGSQISLPAMRLLEAPLTEIVELAVFAS
ncbi:D-fructose-6-phosphate amidotransferase [Oceanicola granulosus HTCC2516]|uniref:D-fructose-6-phosphate amidotransferase n=1 Tax=Oceanicola granulosus (strain ATCC BAA-861 / DSM 15982 / KCTC 12143 / HTCC2516) TaxID=314256 RepID=Q2CIZ9_OCEGH|nr:D-fructose-6-phosphate amidotransferase [Oceanicola granulosus HTCC2516]